MIIVDLSHVPMAGIRQIMQCDPHPDIIQRSGKGIRHPAFQFASVGLEDQLPEDSVPQFPGAFDLKLLKHEWDEWGETRLNFFIGYQEICILVELSRESELEKVKSELNVNLFLVDLNFSIAHPGHMGQTRCAESKRQQKNQAEEH